MALLIGDQSRFAIDIGDVHPSNRTIRDIDVWIAGRRMTCDDNAAYLPQFRESLRRDIGRLAESSDWPALDEQPTLKKHTVGATLTTLVPESASGSSTGGRQ